MVFIRKTKIKGATYLYLVTNRWVNGKVKQKFLGYLGREDKLPGLLEKCLPLRKLLDADLENLLYQTPVSLWKLMEQMKFKETFSHYFSKNWGVDAATAACIMILNYATDRKSKTRLNDWYAQTFLPHLLNVPSEKMNKDLFCRTMDFFTEERIEKIHAEIFKTSKELYKLSDNVLFYDTTPITFEGKECNMAERGYNPAHAYQLQVNLAMPVTAERFPVCHKVFEGNTKDVSTLKKSMEMLDKYGAIEKTIFIFDRGISSDGNFELIKNRKAQFICGLPKNSKIKEDITALKETDFIEIDDDISYYETKKNEDRLLFFWSKKLQEENRLFREKRIERITEKLSNLSKTAKKYTTQRLCEKIGEICGKYRKFFEIKIEPTFSFSINQKKLNGIIATEGKYAILTNANLEPKEVLKRYRDRNFIEMSFKDLKLFVDIRPVRHWKDTRVIAHIFFAILALAVRSVVELKVRRAGLQITSEEALLHLNKVRALVAKGKVLRLTGENEEIRKIVSAIEV
jgi:transposase